MANNWYEIVEEEDKEIKPVKKKKNIRGWYIYKFKQKRAVRIIETWYLNVILL